MLKNGAKGAPGVPARRDDDDAGVKIRRGLAEEVDRLVKEHPEFGLKHRNDFANQAVAKMLRELKHQIYVDLVMQAHKEGKPSPTKELKKLGLDLD